MITKANILICGGGILGLTIAYQLLKRGNKSIVIIDKESELGKHASGRNSGVLHAGIYYPTNTLKAKLCLQGNFLMKKYCKEKSLPLIESGKVVVTKSDKEIDTLNELYNRSKDNGAKVQLINQKELREIEPHATTVEKALYSEYTAIVDPKKIMDSLEQDLMASDKVQILTDTAFLGLQGGNRAVTKEGAIDFDLFINAAGTYSDKVAHAFGVGQNYKLIPFKGLYKKLKAEKAHLVNGNIYPVPDIRNPFLGVHFTKSIHGDVYLGPTAIPALGRENYKILSDVDKEVFSILYRDINMFFSNSKFRQVALTEPRKYIPKYFYDDIKSMVKGLDIHDIQPSDKVGIRPQLVDWKNKELVMDFLVLKEANSIHILNAISPAFTSSMAFSEYILDHYMD